MGGRAEQTFPIKRFLEERLRQTGEEQESDVWNWFGRAFIVNLGDVAVYGVEEFTLRCSL